MMKRITVLACLSVLFMLTSCIITTRPVARAVVKEDDPPTIVVDDDPELIVIPGTYVYWLDGHEGVFFYGGVWWREWRGVWYRANLYSGPWVRIEVRSVPSPVVHVPRNWRSYRETAPIVRWRDTRSHWQSWERERYWDGRRWKRQPPPPPPRR